jgi:hypothetical protein
MTMIATTNLETRIIDALRPHALTLSALAGALRLRLKDVREHVSALEARGVIATRLEAGESGRRARVFALSGRFLLIEEGECALLAESAPREALVALTRPALRIALEAGFGIKLPKKTKKGALIERIFAEREGTFATCRECQDEPVDVAGAVCAICEEASAPVVTAEAPRTRAPRRPDADLDLSAEVLDEVTTLALSQTRAGRVSARGAQRAIALWLGERHEGRVDLLILRTLCKRIGVLNAANFTINMKKDARLFERVENEAGKLTGWRLK